MDRSRPKKIVLLDPSDEKWTFGFNPLNAGISDLRKLDRYVAVMINAMAQVWGGEDTDRTPRLKKCLKLIFWALVEKKLSLYESQYLAYGIDKDVRQAIVRNLQNSTISRLWDQYLTLSPSRFDEEFGSSVNRLIEFVSSPDIQTIVGQIENTIDFKRAMDEGWIVLVNLATKDLSPDNARLLGTLIVNDLFQKALQRKPDVSRPFYLYIDECGDYLNEDIARILDQTRKFGLHLILAHQHLSQLREAGERVYGSVMTDAKTKIVFGGLSATDDADILADELFLDAYNPEKSKKILEKPTVVGYDIIKLHSESRGQSHSEGNSRGSGSGGGFSSGFVEGGGTSQSVTMILPDGLILGGGEQISSSAGSSDNFSHSSGSSESWSEFEGFSSSDSETYSEGTHEALMPILEDRPGGTHSPEEQKIEFKKKIVHLQQQHAIIKLSKKPAVIVKTPFVKPGHARDSRVQAFKEKCFKLQDFTQLRVIVEEQIQARQIKLLTDAREQDHIEAEDQPKEYIEAEIVEAKTVKPTELKKGTRSTKKVKIDDSCWKDE